MCEAKPQSSALTLLRSFLVLLRWGLVLIVLFNFMLTATPWAASGELIYSPSWYSAVLIADSILIALLIPLRSLRLRSRVALAIVLAGLGLIACGCRDSQESVSEPTRPTTPDWHEKLGSLMVQPEKGAFVYELWQYVDRADFGDKAAVLRSLLQNARLSVFGDLAYAFCSEQVQSAEAVNEIISLIFRRPDARDAWAGKRKEPIYGVLDDLNGSEISSLWAGVSKEELLSGLRSSVVTTRLKAFDAWIASGWPPEPEIVPHLEELVRWLEAGASKSIDQGLEIEMVISATYLRRLLVRVLLFLGKEDRAGIITRADAIAGE